MRTFSTPENVDPDDVVWQRLAATQDGINRVLDRRGLDSLQALSYPERREAIIGVQLELNRLAEAAGERTWPLLPPFPRLRSRRRVVPRMRARARPTQLCRRRGRPARRRPRRR